uniref:DUF4283 domain-containing protein n=1 Tax=Cannabis sativa TaxID=3483 RepID=A0A803PB47_CANSA
MNNGVTLVKFNDEATCDYVLEAGLIYFDNKLVIMKPWMPNLYSVKLVKFVPVWHSRRSTSSLVADASSEVKDRTLEKEKATIVDPEAVIITDLAGVDSFSHQVVTTATSNSEGVQKLTIVVTDFNTELETYSTTMEEGSKEQMRNAKDKEGQWEIQKRNSGRIHKWMAKQLNKFIVLQHG